MMNVLNKQQDLNTMQNNSYQEWLDRSLANLRRMSQDEAYRQEVASRATNWAKNPSPETIAELERWEKEQAELKAEFLRQNQEFIDSLS